MSRPTLPMAVSGEEWRPVPGYAGRYMASSAGRIWSNVAGRILSTSVAGRGYLRVGLPIGPGRTTSGYVHRMVALAFHGESEPGHQVRHLDGNNQNNTPENLAWGTAKQNAADQLVHGTSPRFRTNCPNGHPYTAETTRQSFAGRRTIGKLCVICDQNGRTRRKAPLIGDKRLCPPSHRHGASITCRNTHGCQCDSCDGVMRAYRKERGSATR